MPGLGPERPILKGGFVEHYLHSLNRSALKFFFFGADKLSKNVFLLSLYGSTLTSVPSSSLIVCSIFFLTTFSLTSLNLDCYLYTSNTCFTVDDSPLSIKFPNFFQPSLNFSTSFYLCYCCRNYFISFLSSILRPGF